MAVSEVASSINLFVGIVKDSLPILGVIALASVYMYVRTRSGSSNFVRERFWRLLGGSKEFSDETMTAQWQRVNDFEKYRYSSGIKFSSLTQIEAMQSWLAERGVSLEEVLPVANYFDSYTSDLRDPKIKTRMKKTLFYTGLFIVWSAFFSYFSFADALLKVKATNTQFWVSPKQADGAFFVDWTLTPEACGAQSSVVNQVDQDVVCRILTSDQGKKFIEDTRESQRQVSLLMIALGVPFMILVVFSLLKAFDAHHLYIRTRKVEISESHDLPVGGAIEWDDQSG